MYVRSIRIFILSKFWFIDGNLLNHKFKFTNPARLIKLTHSGQERARQYKVVVYQVVLEETPLNSVVIREFASFLISFSNKFY